MTEPVVLTQRRGPVQWITINRAERRNALNQEVVAAIAQAIVEADRSTDCRAIVLTGAGDAAFCAGADLRTTEGGAFDVDYAHPQHYVIDLFKQMEACSLPIVARVNGHAMAGGMGLLCACDMAIACDDARFGTPEAGIGVFPMMILTYMLRIVPRRKLFEMCFTADPFDAREALELGLVNHVVPRAELDARLDRLLTRMIENSPTAFRLGKQAFHAMQDMSLREAFEYAQLMVPVMASTGDAREGMSAFREKRKPVWTGR